MKEGNPVTKILRIIQEDFSVMKFQMIVSKLRKYPTAAAALVFSAVFSFLLAPEILLRTLDFYLVWGLSALFAIHIWCNFKEDRSYKVSGIVPAWLELIAGTILLFTCPIRSVSLIFIMLAVCSYAAGIIFSVKVTGPMVLFLWIAPKLGSINKIINDAMSLVFRRLHFYATGKETEMFSLLTDCPTFGTSTGTALLLWSMLLAVFPLAVYFCKSAYERFSMYCVVVFVFFFCDLLRSLLLINLPCSYPAIIAFWIALAAGVCFVTALLYIVNRFTKNEVSK